MTRESEENLRFRDEFHERIVELVLPALAKGADPGAVGEAVAQAARRSADLLAAALTDRRQDMLAEHRSMWANVETIIDETWGEALDQLYSVIVCAEELGRIWNYANVADAEAEDDAMFGVMSSLLARAARTALEVHLLLTRGFPAGASARARSLYELAIVSRVMVEHGEQHTLPTRYLDHGFIDQYRWVRAHQEHADDLEFEPFTEVDMAELERTRSQLVSVYGEAFAEPYGWAAPLFTGGRIGPTRLEGIVNMDHGRPDYVAQSHDVHPTALGGELNMEVGAQVPSWRLTGLADPANATMVRLAQVLADALVHGRSEEVNQYDVLGLHVVFQLVEEAEHAFLDAEEAAAARIESEPVHPEPPPFRRSAEWASNGE